MHNSAFFTVVPFIWAIFTVINWETNYANVAGLMLYGDFKRLNEYWEANYTYQVIVLDIVSFILPPPSRSPDFLLSLANSYMFSKIYLSQEPTVSQDCDVWFISVFPAHPVHTFIIDCFVYSFPYSFSKHILNVYNNQGYCILKVPIYSSIPNCFISIISSKIRSDLSSNP